MVHNFIPINKYIIKSSYLIHRFKKILNTIIKLSYNDYFIADVSNSYCVISIKENDYNKTGFVTLNCSYVYLQINHGLKSAPHTYFQFSDLVFGFLPATKDKSISWQNIIIE